MGHSQADRPYIWQTIPNFQGRKCRFTRQILQIRRQLRSNKTRQQRENLGLHQKPGLIKHHCNHRLFHPHNQPRSSNEIIHKAIDHPGWNHLHGSYDRIRTPPYALAGKNLSAICSFKQTRMPCTVQITDGQWRIQWQDGVSETYQTLANGNLKDARGGIWTIYSRQSHKYLQHNNGNIIDIFY